MSAVTTQPAVEAVSGPPGRGRGRDWRNLSQLFEKLPPHAIEAEMSLLGSILLEPQMLGDVMFVIKGGEPNLHPLGCGASGRLLSDSIAKLDYPAERAA